MYNMYIKQKVFKILDHYDVYGENGDVIYHVDQDFKWFGHTVNVRKADGSRHFVIDRKIFSWMPRYTIVFDDGNVIEIKQNISFFKKNIDLISNDYNLRLLGSQF